MELATRLSGSCHGAAALDRQRRQTLHWSPLFRQSDGKRGWSLLHPPILEHQLIHHPTTSIPISSGLIKSPYTSTIIPPQRLQCCTCIVMGFSLLGGTLS